MLTISLLCALAFLAGMIDAVVGGGGLIQAPALLNFLPTVPSATLFGTNKVAAVCGTAFATRTFIGRVSIQWQLVLPAAVTAFVMAFLGAAVIASIPQEAVRSVVLVLMVAMAIYTLSNKNFGALRGPLNAGIRQRILVIVLAGMIGFYDGLFGPGAGSLLIFLFIRVFAFDFAQASIHSKIVNLATNIAALLYFIPSGHVLYAIAWPMAICNVLGALAGTRLVLHHGSVFVRALFLVLVISQIVKLSYTMYVPV